LIFILFFFNIFLFFSVSLFSISFPVICHSQNNQQSGLATLLSDPPVGYILPAHAAHSQVTFFRFSSWKITTLRLFIHIYIYMCVCTCTAKLVLMSLQAYVYRSHVIIVVHAGIINGRSSTFLVTSGREFTRRCATAAGMCIRTGPGWWIITHRRSSGIESWYE
jgi:hypothetical protein